MPNSLTTIIDNLHKNAMKMSKLHGMISDKVHIVNKILHEIALNDQWKRS